MKYLLAFALVLLMSSAAWGDSLRVTMAAKSDDVHLKNGTYSGYTGSNDYAGKMGRESGTAFNQYVRFDNITLSGNVVFDSVYCWVWGYATDGGSCTLSIRGEDTADAATYPTTSDLASRQYTTDSVIFAPGAYSGAGVHLGNWAAPTQEIYNRGDWTSGNAMAYRIVNNKASAGDALRYSRTYDYFADGGGTPAPVIVFYYHIVASDSGKRRRDMMQLGALDERFPVWGQWEAVQ